jgi:DNA-binding NarL/FixJ family response regulator
MRPDVAVMDLRMPRLDGIGATARIVAEEIATQVLVMTTFDDEELVYRALRAGASGFLLKDASSDQLVEAIRTVYRGQAILAPEITRAVISRYAAVDRSGRGHLTQAVDPLMFEGGSSAGRPQPAAVALSVLTDRELEVLVLVAEGLSNREIGRRVFVSEGTVKTHVSNILAKTARHSRVQLVGLAYEGGLLGSRDA